LHEIRNIITVKSIIYFEFIPQGYTINHTYFMEILRQLHEAVLRKGLNFGPVMGISTTTVLQLTRCSMPSSFWTRNQLLKWNTHTVSLIWVN